MLKSDNLKDNVKSIIQFTKSDNLSPICLLLMKFNNDPKHVSKTNTSSIHNFVVSTWGEPSNEELYSKIFTFINTRRIRKDAIEQKKIMMGLLNLFDSYKDSNPVIARDLLINVTFGSENEFEFMKNLKNLETLIGIFHSEIPDKWLSKQCMRDFDNTMSNHIKSVFDIPDNLGEEVFDFLNNFRHKEALFTYLSKIELSRTDLTPVKDQLKNLILQCIEGTFHQNRYDTNNSKHLSKVFGDKILLKEWKKGQKYRITRLKNNKQNTFSVEDTDNPNDLFLIGTEVHGSCMSVYDDTYYSKCLMAYLMDGKNRAIIVRDENTNKIQARAMLRILIDSQKNQPVLCIEKLYRAAGSPDQSAKWIKDFAIERAKKLKLDLVTRNNHYNAISRGSSQNNVLYPNNLLSLDSPSTYEYVEDFGVSNGTFCVPKSNLSFLYKHC
jgi:hypothetical protein